MIPASFTALTVSNIHNGTTTFALPIEFSANAAQPRTVRAIGGGVLDMYASSSTRSLRVPEMRTVRYLASFATAVLLNTHINRLMVDDVGKRGTLTYTGNDTHSYTQTAALRNVAAMRLTASNNETRAMITLTIEELTLVTRVP